MRQSLQFSSYRIDPISGPGDTSDAHGTDGQRPCSAHHLGPPGRGTMALHSLRKPGPSLSTFRTLKRDMVSKPDWFTARFTHVHCERLSQRPLVAGTAIRANSTASNLVSSDPGLRAGVSSINIFNHTKKRVRWKVFWPTLALLLRRGNCKSLVEVRAGPAFEQGLPALAYHALYAETLFHGSEPANGCCPVAAGGSDWFRFGALRKCRTNPFFCHLQRDNYGADLGRHM